MFVYRLAAALAVFVALSGCSSRPDPGPSAELKATRGRISDMAKRHSADTDWEASLPGGDTYRMEPPLAVEMEEAFKPGRKYLLIGSVKDLATVDADNFRVLLRVSGSHVLSTPGVEFSSVAPKERLQSYRNGRARANGKEESGGVAIVASVSKVTSRRVSDSDGERTVHTLHGLIFDAVYIEDLLSFQTDPQ